MFRYVRVGSRGYIVEICIGCGRRNEGIDRPRTVRTRICQRLLAALNAIRLREATAMMRIARALMTSSGIAGMVSRVILVPHFGGTRMREIGVMLGRRLMLNTMILRLVSVIIMLLLLLLLIVLPLLVMMMMLLVVMIVMRLLLLLLMLLLVMVCLFVVLTFIALLLPVMMLSVLFGVSITMILSREDCPFRRLIVLVAREVLPLIVRLRGCKRGMLLAVRWRATKLLIVLRLISVTAVTIPAVVVERQRHDAADREWIVLWAIVLPGILEFGEVRRSRENVVVVVVVVRVAIRRVGIRGAALGGDGS